MHDNSAYRKKTLPSTRRTRVRHVPLPRFRAYGQWSAETLAVCVALVVVSLAAMLAAFALVHDDAEHLLRYASQNSQADVTSSVPYGTLVVLALIPAIIIGGVVWFLDRWEPEPPIMYVIAAGWGAGVSVLMAYAGNDWWAGAARSLAPGPEGYSFLTVVIGPAVIEEATKAFGLLVLFLLLSKYINGPMDGIVYGLLIGVGFAFTENILYFSRASVAEMFGGAVNLSGMETWTVSSIFFGRAVITPLVHPLATAITGLFVGLASLTKRPRANLLPLALLGFVLAAALHGLHNHSTLAGGGLSVGVRLLLQVPVYLGAVMIIYYAAGLQRREVLQGLREYANAGWVSPNEIPMVMNIANRRRALTWAAASAAELGRSEKEGRSAMKAFQAELLQLGYARTVNVQRRTAHEAAVRAREAARLAHITQLREVFTTEVEGRES